jgi:hypothetical protein
MSNRLVAFVGFVGKLRLTLTYTHPTTGRQRSGAVKAKTKTKRPSYAINGSSRMITARVSHDLHERINHVATSKGLSRTDVVVSALDTALPPRPNNEGAADADNSIFD